mmetsp:Transcript_26162/g.39546  ORF Transcript_26162/g.39546 Transcript_26162/m.39546 type:complete len:217 (-) Transcript_26162:1081-1731(-)
MTTSRRSNTIISTIIFISLCIIAITTINLRNNENSKVSARRTITDSQIIMSSRQQQESVQPRTNNMVGGYSNLGRDKNLLKSEQVVKVSNYALKEHAKKSTSTASVGHALTISKEEVESGQVTAVVLEAQQQVVAGLNYKLTIALMKDSTCLGALKVTVYDRFGDLRVTKWGDQLTCDDVQDLLTEVMQVEEESEEKALDVEEKIEEGMEEVEPNE